MLAWLEAAALIPTPQVLTEAIECVREDLTTMEADPAFKRDLQSHSLR